MGGVPQVSLHDVRFDRDGSANSVGAMRAVFQRSIFEAPSVSSRNTSGFGGSNTPGHSLFERHTSFTTPKLAVWERLFREAGINDADALFVFRPGSERVTLRTAGEIFNQGMHLDRQGLTYSVEGQPIGDLTRWLMGANEEFSAVTVWTDGRQYALTPSYTFKGIAPGTSMSISSNVGKVLSVTEGLTPKFNHMFSGDLHDPTSGADIANGRLVMNSYRLFSFPDATMTRFDFQGDLLDASLVFGTGRQGHNFVAMRGIGNPNQSALQGDLMYLQNRWGGSGIAGSLSVFGDLGHPQESYRIGLEGYHLLRGGVGEFDPLKGAEMQQLGTESQTGFQFFFELQR